MSSVYSAPRTRGPSILTPNQVSGLVGWWDASRTDSLTVDGSNGVSAWADLSGQGYTLEQGTEANRPTLTAAALGGRQALVFAPNDHIEVESAVVTAAPVTLFAVVADGASRGIVSIANPASGADWFELYQIASPGDANFLVRSSAAQGLAARAAPAGDVHVISGVATSSASRNVRIDGVTGATETTAVTPSGLSRTSIGRIGDVSPSYLTGTVGEVLIFNVALADAQRSAIEAYLALKWGVTLA